MTLQDRDLKTFLAERNKAMTEFDLDYVARTLPAIPVGMRELVLHKSRYECTAIAPELRHASGQWLRERGHARMTGTPVLPEGELPE